jgi:hypothetical protein
MPSSKWQVLPLALAAIALAGCTAAPSDPSTSATSDAEAAQFVACLTAQGQTAKILVFGQVGVLLPEGVGPDSGLGTESGTAAGGDETSGNGAPVTVTVMQDDEGSWTAASSADGYPTEGGIRDAWAACETELPDFVQPEPNIEGTDIQVITKDDLVKASLAFAKCARANGYADFADPDSEGMLSFPLGMTEDEFRSLLDVCNDTLGEIGLPIAPTSADSFDFDWMSIVLEFGGGKRVVGTGPGPDSGSN